jgi:hypothetical protein
MKTLAKEHMSITANRDPGTGFWSIAPGNYGNWTQPFIDQGVFLSSTYFDLAGMSLKEKTLFFKGAIVQDVLNPSVVAQAAGDSLGLVDLMSTRPLTDNEVFSFLINGNFAGPLNSGITFNETVYGRVRQYVVDLDTQAWGSMVLVSDNQLGSMNPTASDRIYSYRLISVDGTLTQLTTYAARHVLSVDVKEEAEYQYLMRLMRSYELQQRYDED